MPSTRKVKHAGRFGSRYGKGIRDRIVAVEKIQRTKHECPNCGFKRVKRISTGLYKCSKCGFTFAGGAFVPNTMSGKIVKKMVSQRKFLPLVKELIETREEQSIGLEEKKAEKKQKETGTKKHQVKEPKQKTGKTAMEKQVVEKKSVQIGSTAEPTGNHGEGQVKEPKPLPEGKGEKGKE